MNEHTGTGLFPNPTYLYIIEDGSAYKIGYSSDPNKRLSTLQVGNRSKLRLLYIVEFECKALAYLAEVEVHTLLKEYSIRGEWFSLTLDQITSLIRRFPSDSVTSIEYTQRILVSHNFVKILRQVSSAELHVIDILSGEAYDNSCIVELRPDSIYFDDKFPDSMKYTSFRKAYNLLYKKDLMRRVRRNYYMLNPDFFCIGGEQAAFFERIWAESTPYESKAEST